MEKTIADKMYDKLEAKATEKGFRLSGGVGDYQGWSVALVRNEDAENTKYAVIDYADYYEDGMAVYWFNMTYDEPIEDMYLGHRKTPNGVLNLVKQQY